MEKQNLSLYAKLKNNLHKEITISYYSNSVGFKTENFRLIDICGFSYITIGNKKVFLDMEFFSTTTIIESITIVGDNHPIYFNPYIRKHINKNNSLNNEMLQNIKNDFFNSINMEEIITKKEIFLIKYFQKKIIEWQDLFFSDTQKKDFLEFLKLLINELVQYAKDNGLDSSIIPIMGGSTTLVYNIGDKVIKIGRPRQKLTIPYCEFLLQPIINKVVVFDNIPIQVEITEKVTTYNELDDKGKRKLAREIPKLQRKLHSIGLKCSDLHKGNIGILTSDNIIHFSDFPFETGSESVTSIKNNNNLAVRKKGEVVIIDLDYLEVINVNRYHKYLTSIGFQLENNNNEQEISIKR